MPTTNDQSDRLPTYLRPFPKIRPARPSQGSSGSGSDMGVTHTWKPPDQSSLHNVCRTGTRLIARCKLLFLQRISSTALSTPKCIGGAERDRTADPLLAKQVLSQLSYSPNFWVNHQETAASKRRSLTMQWWARVDSNYRPHAYQACALTN